MIRFSFIIFILFLSALNVLPQSLSEKNISRIAQAKSRYFSGNDSAALAITSQILESNPENEEAHLLQALLHLNEHQVHVQIQARQSIEKFHRHLKNPFSYLANGLLQLHLKNEKGARRSFEKALELRPGYFPALLELGRFHGTEVFRYLNKFTDTEVALSYRRFAMIDFDKAVYYLKQALEIRPEHPEALKLLCKLYFELEEYGEMLNLLERAGKDFRDKNLYLYLGLAHTGLHNYDEAEAAFKNAFRLMPPAEKLLFYEPKYLPHSQSKDSLYREFWKTRDPLFLTAENERLLTHWERMAYSQLYFGVAKPAVPGWETDRGKTLIRYGKPDHIIDYGKSMDAQAIFSPTQIWIYPGFNLAFTDEYWNSNYRFAEPNLSSLSRFRERTNLSYSLVSENLEEQLPELYQLHSGGRLMDAGFHLISFKNEAETISYLTFAFQTERYSQAERQKIEGGIFFLDRNAAPLESFQDQFIVDTPRKDSLRDYRTQLFKHPSGQFAVSVEILNRTEKQSRVWRDSVEIPDFSVPGITMSDLLLAQKLTTNSAPGAIIRNGLSMVPVIKRNYSPADTLLLYFELYNLPGNRHSPFYYKVENRISRQESHSLLASLFGKKEQGISLINDYSSDGAGDFVIQALDLSQLRPGKYKLEIRVKPEQRNMTLQRTAFIQIEESLTN
ncbi:MAG: GWxTD domain-containing protein [Calditrichia bacterium]